MDINIDICDDSHPTFIKKYALLTIWQVINFLLISGWSTLAFSDRVQTLLISSEDTNKSEVSKIKFIDVQGSKLKYIQRKISISAENFWCSDFFKVRYQNWRT